MTRTWLSRVAQLLKTPKKSARPVSGHPRLGVEALEDRSVPTSYTFDATANTLLITLGTNEVLTVTADATNTTFALSGGSGSPVFTQNGGDPATSGSGTATIGIANTDLTSSLTVDNTGAAATSNNDVTFVGGTVTSGAITVTLTDTDGGSDRDDITLSGGTLAGATNLSTENGSVVVGTVSVGATTGAEGGADGTIVFTRTGDLSQPLTVNFTIGAGSTATFGTDYVLAAGANTTFTFSPATSSGTVTFAAGSGTATLVVDVTNDSANETTETVVVNVAAATGGQYTVAPGAGTTATLISDNDGPGNGNGNGNGNNNGNNGVRTRARPAFSNAMIFGNQMFLFGPDGEVKAVVPVTRGTQVAFADLTGDGSGDVVVIEPGSSVVVDGQTGLVLAVFADFDFDGVADIFLFSPDTGAPSSVSLSRSGRTFPLA